MKEVIGSKQICYDMIHTYDTYILPYSYVSSMGVRKPATEVATRRYSMLRYVLSNREGVELLDNGYQRADNQRVQVQDYDRKTAKARLNMTDRLEMRYECEIMARVVVTDSDIKIKLYIRIISQRSLNLV